MNASTIINILSTCYTTTILQTGHPRLPFLANGVHRRLQQRPRKIWKTLSNGVGGSRGMPRPWSALNVRRGCPGSSSPSQGASGTRFKTGGGQMYANDCKCMVTLGIFPVRKCSVWVGNIIMTPLYHELQYHSIDGGIANG